MNAEFELRTILASVKSERACKQCGVNVGKGKQLCQECRDSNRKTRESKNLKGVERLPSFLNFRRNADGKPIEKQCTICNTWLPVSGFTKRADTASGCRAFCKACDLRYGKKFIKPSIPKPVFDQTCQRCGVTFTAKLSRGFCSSECAGQARRDVGRLANNSIHVATEAKCRRRGCVKPLDDFRSKRQHGEFKCLPSACRSCKEDSMRRNKRNSCKARDNNPRNKPRKRLSKRFQETMRMVKKGGSYHLRDMIGCSTAMLRSHLESQFTRGIRWSNYGTKWHVDHILPVASFDHNDADQVRRCWHYSNLRPLCAIANGLKSDSIITCQPELLLQLT